jgi:hypothetical protein
MMDLGCTGFGAKTRHVIFPSVGRFGCQGGLVRVLRLFGMFGQPAERLPRCRPSGCVRSRRSRHPRVARLGCSGPGEAIRVLPLSVQVHWPPSSQYPAPAGSAGPGLGTRHRAPPGTRPAYWPAGPGRSAGPAGPGD